MKNIKKLFLLLIFIFLTQANNCLALEILPKDYPVLPFTKPITEFSSLPDYVVYFFALGIIIAGFVAVVSLAIAGIQFILSAENPEMRNGAISRMKGIFLGIVLLVGSYMLIGKINPELQTIKMQPLNPLGGLQLAGNNKMTSAPMHAASLDDIRKNYSTIWWPDKIKNTEGKLLDNCDPNNENATYIIYWYFEKNFKKFWDLTRLKCREEVPFESAQSYIIVKEEPGVYFYQAADCKPPNGSDSSALPNYYTNSIPNWNGKNIVSMRIVNGPDPDTGPFYGAITFNSQDYKTTPVMPISGYIPFSTTRLPDDNYSDCVNVKEVISTNSDFFPIGSAVIYKWAGFKDVGNKTFEVNNNCSVTLYTMPAWKAGYYELSVESQGKQDYSWFKKLKDIQVVYKPGAGVPLDEQKLCPSFDPSHSCLQSFEIKGNCLVVISSTKAPDAYAQAFPISPEIVWKYEDKIEGYSIERGTPELASEYIGSRSAEYIYVIPLAENLVTSK